jgi:hypothetical protein
MMLREIGWSLALVVGVLLVVARAESPVVPTAVVGPKEATFAEKLAVKEVRRYVYARTGKLLPIVEGQLPAEGGLIVVGTKDQPLVKQLLADAKLKTTVEGLAAEQYVVKTIQQGSRPVILAAGGDTTGTLYAAYRLAEHLGVRFYMHGDVVPDKQIPPAIAPIDEVGKPLFDRRGIQPFHDFPEGPDWWNLDDYMAILGQLAKMRMNFFGLHTYPQGGVGPEPLTWIGVPGDVGPDGKPKFSYPSRHYVTQNVTGAWGYRSMKTSDFSFMAANIFPRDDYGADYMQGTYPWNKMTVAESNALFERMGEVLRDSFTLARQLGIKTCIGTETPLIIPSQVKERLRQAGKNPDDPAVCRKSTRACSGGS